jgi:hypothetical protein
MLSVLLRTMDVRAYAARLPACRSPRCSLSADTRSGRNSQLEPLIEVEKRPLVRGGDSTPLAGQREPELVDLVDQHVPRRRSYGDGLQRQPEPVKLRAAPGGTVQTTN